MWKEFRPALKFLFVFLGLYLAGNILYGVFIEYYHNDPDPVTRALGHQTSYALQALGTEAIAVDNTQGPTIFIRHNDKTILSVYEGCNGINVMIVFIAFVVAFGGNKKKMVWFIPLGIVLLHIANIVRVALLYFVAIGYESYFYYVHKYVFTAVLYLITFVLWYIWVARINGKPK